MNLTFLAAAEPLATGKLLIDWNTILLAIITLMGTLGGPWIAYLVLKVKANSEKTAAALLVVSEKTDAVSEKTDKAVEVLNEVKKDVNSGRTKLEEKLTRVEDKLLVATGEKATSDEKVRSEQDKAVALAATKTTSPLPAAVHSGPARMSKAISELQDAASETIDQSEATTESAEKTEELARKHKP